MLLPFRSGCGVGDDGESGNARNKVMFIQGTQRDSSMGRGDNESEIRRGYRKWKINSVLWDFPVTSAILSMVWGSVL